MTFFALIKILLAILLSPLSALYWLITSVRNWCYDVGLFKSTSFDIPIVSVGNLAVGGSGKTPMVEYLIRNLQDKYSIAVLSRGYGRKTKGFLWVEAYLSSNLTGDEPLQIKTKYSSIYVAVCEDRVAGVTQILIEKPEVNLVVLDDAFQHRAIRPSIQLLLSTYSKPFYRDWLLPAGRLREKRNGAKRADAIIFTKCLEKHALMKWKDKPIFYSKITYESLEISGKVYGFSGLAENLIFKNHLAKTYKLVGFTSFSDHYNYTQEDLWKLLKKASGATLVCTEKDWTKIKFLQNTDSVRFISITTVLEGEQDFMEWFKHQLHSNNIGSVKTKNNES